MRVVTTFSCAAGTGPPARGPRPPAYSHVATDTPCRPPSVAAALATGAVRGPNVNRRVCCPASVSTFSVFSVSHVMCSRVGTRMMLPAPYALHLSSAVSFAGSHASAARLPSGFNGTLG